MSSPASPATDSPATEAGPDTGQGGVKAWAGALVGIVAWTVHIVSLASLVDLICRQPSLEWVLHLITGATAGVTLLGLWWCLALVRGGASDAAGDRPGRLRFLGLFGLILSGFSLLLILWEGSYVLFLDPCA
jgi:hypothetical protein